MYDWKHEMGNGDDSFFSQKKLGENSKRLGSWAIERYGLPTVILAVVWYFVFQPWWDNYLEAEKLDRADQANFLQVQVDSIRKQTSAIERLSDRAVEERVFEATVVTSHQNAEGLLQRNNELMEDANAKMAKVPKQNEQKLLVLKEISDGIKKLQ